MPSRIGKFFEKKRPWSRVKDSILGYYLEPYTAKLSRLGKPIVIVDCFAGAGTFGDGEPGSPLIIAPIVKKYRDKGTNIRAELIEADPTNFQRLQASLSDYRECTEAKFGTFEDHLERLARLAETHSVFLYADPYTVKPLVFAKMKAVFDQIRKGASVELLLNLNVPIFMRWALAALKRHPVIGEGADYLADDPNEVPELAELNAIAGGDYWKEIGLATNIGFPDQVERFTDQYRQRLTDSFNFVASYPVFEKWEHDIPKYSLVFGTRHPDGFELMNDGMCEAQREFLGKRFSKDRLFDHTPDSETGDPERLVKDILEILADGKRMTRKAVRQKAIPLHFCFFESKEINAAIGQLLKTGKLFSSNGKTRINEDVLLSMTPFTSPQKV
jgi:three-Cys-motif partner protein